ncbi:MULTISPECIES: helix-turn-helix domain-containing protein [unclassified Pseudomonas]|uniref:helix-turn-helix domain-containing protein n=1 Tax=unclassified Pseudomonas TaxID=196821 RepID=UPI0025D04224|nr:MULTISPECIES: helix-turn-helix transcriptional regulator [unclassified Pseudomonas]
MSVFSKRLKQARTVAGLSQERLGIESGIDPASASARMNQYETGKHTPNSLTIIQIAAALDISPAYFYSIDDEEARMLLLFHGLDSPGKKQILTLAVELHGANNAYKTQRIQ